MDADGDTLNIYYGAVDGSIPLARATGYSLLKWLDANGSCERRQRPGFMKLLLNIFQFVFGCRHRHLSRVFTIKHRTYKVCFDCGQEFDLPDPFGAGSPSDTSQTVLLPTNPHHAR